MASLDAGTAPVATSTNPGGAGGGAFSSPSQSAAAAARTLHSSPAAVYGRTVDVANAAAADKDKKPGVLPQRSETALASAGGRYQGPQKGFIEVTSVMSHRDDKVTLSRKSYIRVRYESAYFNRPGVMVMPTWTGLQGQLFQVGSGGGSRMDDRQGDDPAYAWMSAPGPGLEWASSRLRDAARGHSADMAERVLLPRRNCDPDQP